MSFWDNPANWPGEGNWPNRPGETITGTITRMELAQSRYGRQQLVVELDGDGTRRWCNSRLWRTMGEARIEPGDHIRVTRGQDEPNPGGKPGSTWIVERLQPTPATAQAAGYGQPRWGAPAPAATPAAAPAW